jgi:hypothetical protein
MPAMCAVTASSLDLLLRGEGLVKTATRRGIDVTAPEERP